MQYDEKNQFTNLSIKWDDPFYTVVDSGAKHSNGSSVLYNPGLDRQTIQVRGTPSSEHILKLTQFAFNDEALVQRLGLAIEAFNSGLNQILTQGGVYTRNGIRIATWGQLEEWMSTENFDQLQITTDLFGVYYLQNHSVFRRETGVDLSTPQVRNGNSSPTFIRKGLFQQIDRASQKEAQFQIVGEKLLRMVEDPAKIKHVHKSRKPNRSIKTELDNIEMIITNATYSVVRFFDLCEQMWERLAADHHVVGVVESASIGRALLLQMVDQLKNPEHD